MVTLPDSREPLDTNRQRPASLRVSHSRIPLIGPLIDGASSPRLVRFSKMPLSRRWISMVVTVVSLASVVGLSGMLFKSRSRPMAKFPSSNPSSPSNPPALPEYLQSRTYLAGPPTTNFRDTLRNDTAYLTSWLSAGWTNDVMTISNLIYLALITSRVPILPPLTSQIGGDSIPIRFSSIFDIDRVVQAIDSPVLEWHEVKDIEAAEELGERARDEVGCWNIWEVDNVETDAPRGSYTVRHLNLDISYTRAPASVKLIPGFQHDSHSTFWALAPLAFPESRAAILANPIEHPTRPSEYHGVILPPDEQLLCYDYLYYLCANQPFDFEKDYNPSWRFVAQHFHWTKPLELLAQRYLRYTFGLPNDAVIPPYITIHVRHGDFGSWCNVPLHECFAPLSAYKRRVEEIKEELRERWGIEVQHVIMTGDERDERWWENVKEMGWLRLDYANERTVETYGKWYPVIVDAVIQSGGIGFVGTDRSTFSMLARRRVLDWNNGVVRNVLWGHLNADTI